MRGDGRIEHSLFRVQANGFRLEDREFRTLDSLVSQYRQELLRLATPPARHGPTRSLSRGDLDDQGYVQLPRTDG